MDYVDPDFGLLKYLLIKFLNQMQFDKVRVKETVHERSEALLDLLTTDDQCQVFLEALQQTDQQHVVNFINQNGGLKHML